MPVRGARQTSANLRELSRYVTVPLNAASRYALAPTLSAARQNVRQLPLKETTGTLAASLAIKRDPKSPKVSPKHQVGPSSDFSRETQYGTRRPVKYAHLVEFGTAKGARAMPFLTPAYDSTKGTVVKRFGDRIGPEMEKRAAKLGAKVRK